MDIVSLTIIGIGIACFLAGTAWGKATTLKQQRDFRLSRALDKVVFNDDLQY